MNDSDSIATKPRSWAVGGIALSLHCHKRKREEQHEGYLTGGDGTQISMIIHHFALGEAESFPKSPVLADTRPPFHSLYSLTAIIRQG